MKIRPYFHAQDFAVLREWTTDRRTHALWCADRFPYPPAPDSFAEALQAISAQTGDEPYIAEDENGNVAGFFCRSLHPETHEAMLKFVIVDPAQRGNGIGTAMLRAAAADIFSQTDAEAVHLNVFSVNAAAIRCYRKAGFRERTLTPDAFRYENELWGRCNMIIQKENDSC